MGERVFISFSSNPDSSRDAPIFQVTRGFGRRRLYRTCKDDSRLPDVVARGIRVDLRGRPQPKRVTSPARATTVIGPTWPPTSSHYIPCMLFLDFAVPESTSIIYPVDYHHPFHDKVLTHIECWTSLVT